MKKFMLFTLTLALSAYSVAQGFQDPNHPKAHPEKPHHGMKHERAHKEGKPQGFFDESNAVKSVTALKDAKDDAFVLLSGKIVKQVGKDEFIFRDATGEVEVEISHRAWQGEIITPNDTVEIRGKVDKEWDKTEIEIKQVMKK